MLSSQLRDVLERSRLPVRELATISGISAATIFKFRKDPNTSLTLANAEALAAALGLELIMRPGIQPPASGAKEPSTGIGYVNRNNQQVVSSHVGTMNGRPVRLYRLRCNDCQGPEYEARSYVIWQRKCPHCQK
jgi:hypothetical protein